MYGSAIYCLNCAQFNLTKSRFVYNQAIKGGAIFLEYLRYFTNQVVSLDQNLQDVQIENITSFESGGFQYFAGNNFNSSNSLLKCRFFNIKSSLNSIQNSLDFQPTQNKLYGGGIFMFSVKQVDLNIKDSFFENIEALQLGGILLLDSNYFSQFILQNNSFKNISGRNQGAMIYSQSQNYQKAVLIDNRIDCHPYSNISEEQNQFMKGEEILSTSQTGSHIFYFESEQQSTLLSQNNTVINCINQYSEIIGNLQRQIVSGGVYMLNTNIVMTDINSTYANNSAYFGGIYYSISNSKFINNIPNMAGGLIKQAGEIQTQNIILVQNYS
ncbi:UNKNOWN [Stylonychia lemnae]|uniref:Uncharacterized protein n=1 Tax=Stylonychia lemnae TaxID=5949 RepID=A0A078AWS8_STYLE|nr:UNKNOWN [Stylonychia lemnae]|eukprot:CDW85712.1 UNKNOWN [Stylonychia lemnae]